MSTISRFFSRGMSARWFGEPVGFSVVDTETAEIYYDRDPRLAELMGLKGNQYDGFRAHVPFVELQDIEERAGGVRGAGRGGVRGSDAR